MRLVTFNASGRPRAGVIGADETVVAAADVLPGAPEDMIDLIAAWPVLGSQLAAAAARSRGGLAVDVAKLLAPIPRPRRNVFCVGWNYAEHFAEGKAFREGQGIPDTGPQDVPDYPALFSKNPATVTGPDAPVWFPSPHSTSLDWECELAVIVGTGGRDVSDDRAHDHIFGYTCANDVSVRDVQRRHGGQWFRGKNYDGHLPLGPWIVTADELADPNDLRISTRVNGVTKQDSRTRHLVFKIPRLIRELSAGAELWPGDIIITGTPQGVGFARKPPEFMKVGDVVEVEIEGIGTLRNRIEERK